MPGSSKNKNNQREAAVSRTAALEQLIAQIDTAQKSASSSYHKSELAERSLSNANAAIAEAVKSLSLGHYDQVDRMLNVTWFYAKFAQDIVGAEATEHLLGNDRFLDLIEPASKVQADLKELVGSIRAMLDEYNSSIPQFWELDLEPDLEPGLRKDPGPGLRKNPVPGPDPEKDPEKDPGPDPRRNH